MTQLDPDYDSDPQRWGAWKPPSDIHEVIAPELRGPILDVGCGEGRLASLVVPRGVTWVGLDSSPAQLQANPYRPVVQADMRALPFRDGAFGEITQLWCLYHLPKPEVAIQEAHRVLAGGGRYYACTSARDSDPELMPEGYPPSSFDAEEALDIVATVFAIVDAGRWNEAFSPLESREELRAFCRHHFIPVERAERAELPLWLTKRGVLVRATKS